jgi:hypothetical protein
VILNLTGTKEALFDVDEAIKKEYFRTLAQVMEAENTLHNFVKSLL